MELDLKKDLSLLRDNKIITKREFDMLFKYYIEWLTLNKIWKSIWVTRERIRQIIKRWRNKIYLYVNFSADTKELCETIKYNIYLIEKILMYNQLSSLEDIERKINYSTYWRELLFIIDISNNIWYIKPKYIKHNKLYYTKDYEHRIQTCVYAFQKWIEFMKEQKIDYKIEKEKIFKEFFLLGDAYDILYPFINQLILYSKEYTNMWEYIIPTNKSESTVDRILLTFEYYWLEKMHIDEIYDNIVSLFWEYKNSKSTILMVLYKYKMFKSVWNKTFIIK